MTRSIIRIGLALVLALLCSWTLLAQKGKPAPSPEIINVNIALDNSPDKAIRPEGTSTVPVMTPYAGRLYPRLREGTPDTYDYNLVWSLTLSRSSSLEPQRSVVLQFDYRNPLGNGMLTCYPTPAQPGSPDALKGPYMFPAPEFLLNSPYTPDGNQKPFSVSFATDVEFTLENGAWVRSDDYFDFGPYFLSPATAKDVTYVEWLVAFTTPELAATGAQAYIAHNGPVQFNTVMGYTRGLVQITKGVNGGFVVRPIPSDVLNGTTFPPIYQTPSVQVPPDSLPYRPSALADHANLSLSVSIPRKAGYKASYAICDLGPFVMPFEMTVTRQ